MTLALGLGLAIGTLSAASVVQANRGGEVPASEPGLFGLYARLSLELESHLQTDELSAQARITLGPGGRDVRLAGELDEGASDRLKRLLDANPSIERIHLTSEGGLVDEGEAVGALIAARGLVAYVPDYCVSACTLAFIRGRERFIVPNARLGFHAPYETGLFGQDFQADAAPERAAYLAAGLSPGFVDAALKVSSSELWVPDAQTLLKAGVATGIVDTRRFPDSTLDDGAEPADARSAVLRNVPLMRAVEAAEPRLVDAVAAWYLDAYRTGLSEAEAADGIRRRSAQAASRVLREADDPTIVALGRLLLRAMAKAEPSDTRACVAIGAEGNVVLAEEVLPSTDTAAARGLIERAGLRARRLGLRLALEDDRDPAPRPREGSCAGFRRAYGEALSLPPRAAAAALRRLVFPPPPVSLEASARP